MKLDVPGKYVGLPRLQMSGKLYSTMNISYIVTLDWAPCEPDI